ncbi:MAG: phosphatidylglycerophosphatase A [Magnetococcales bacterium]|nr:phosphatidylglycerophosphatase A [Magnetococcales bacterium]NGZ25424.1 phosphatidylglycerophosphatase A [Magnetococcales bacterium]
MAQHRWLNLLATWGGTGYSPKAPGTVGSLAALPLWWAISPLNPWLYGAIVLTICLLGTWAAHHYSQQENVADPKQVVIDEVVGVLITLAGVPWSWQDILAGFLLFRLFDILKPWPVGWLDRHVHGGVGIMADDVAAGILAWLVLHLSSNFLATLVGT